MLLFFLMVEGCFSLKGGKGLTRADGVGYNRGRKAGKVDDDTILKVLCVLHGGAARVL